MATSSYDDLNGELVGRARENRRRIRNPFGRLVLFFREVFGELRKVQTPTWGALLRYTLLVLVFVAIMMVIITACDLLFGSLVGSVFGTDPLFGMGGGA